MNTLKNLLKGGQQEEEEDDDSSVLRGLLQTLEEVGKKAAPESGFESVGKPPPRKAPWTRTLPPTPGMGSQSAEFLSLFFISGSIFLQCSHAQNVEANGWRTQSVGNAR